MRTCRTTPTSSRRCGGRASAATCHRVALCACGVAYTAPLRKFLSWLLNVFLRRFWSLPVRDVSSGYRLYRRVALQGLEFKSVNFEVLGEVLVRLYARGYSVTEVPFTYFPRESGRSHVRLFRFGMDQLRSAVRMWKLRNSLESADYDERAYYSIIPIQRYWQRRRHHITVSWARGAGRILDAGCGSSLIIQSLNNAIGMEVNFSKLRFLRRCGIPLTRGPRSRCHSRMRLSIADQLAGNRAHPL